MFIMKQHLLFIAMAVFMAVGSTALSATEASKNAVTVSFTYIRQVDSAFNQMAVWIEDANGNYVKSLYASPKSLSSSTVLPVWYEKARAANLSAAEKGFVASNELVSGDKAYVWDCTDKDGNAVAAGRYHYCVESSTPWNTSIVYRGTIAAGTPDAVSSAYMATRAFQVPQLPLVVREVVQNVTART
jgi:hypothetical protein